ncbi:Transmembrane 68 [Brachionus plicatilis]|uniref:Transmembrane 68 n=1 Tax=Brachionus plicatilis TaxID=10195 RepID=A0A3M7Q073_BRAPC|nr:Transmembrane 68 [Brachionus plicatilis]
MSKSKGKHIVCSFQNFLKPLGYQTFLEGVEHIPGTIDSCVSMLKKGEIFLIYPGGVNEGLKSNGYNLLWKANAGFAKLAQQAKVPVIPLFTKNTRQVSAEISFIGKLIPIGWFPVKLQTFVGERIEYNENRSVEELVSMSQSY